MWFCTSDCKLSIHNPFFIMVIMHYIAISLLVLSVMHVCLKFDFESPPWKHVLYTAKCYKILHLTNMWALFIYHVKGCWKYIYLCYEIWLVSCVCIIVYTVQPCNKITNTSLHTEAYPGDTTLCTGRKLYEYHTWMHNLLDIHKLILTYVLQKQALTWH